MSLWEQIQAALGGGQSAPPPEEPPPARPESATPPAAPDPRIAELSRQLATERAARIETAAEQFVAAHSDRLVPAERAAVRELYVQAATDDAAHPLAEGSRVASLSAREAARRPHRLREELLPAGSAILGNAPPSAEEEEADLAASIARARRTAGERPGNGRAH